MARDEWFNFSSSIRPIPAAIMVAIMSTVATIAPVVDAVLRTVVVVAPAVAPVTLISGQHGSFRHLIISNTHGFFRLLNWGC